MGQGGCPTIACSHPPAGTRWVRVLSPPGRYEMGPHWAAAGAFIRAAREAGGRRVRSNTEVTLGRILVVSQSQYGKDGKYDKYSALRRAILTTPPLTPAVPRCLVHCAAGINRSGFVAAAELLLHSRLPVLEATLTQP